MRTIYLLKESNNVTRKILIDMAYLSSHKIIRLPKIYFEEGIYLPYKNNNTTEKYYLDNSKIISEDHNHYFFKFPFRPDQVDVNIV